MIDGNEHDLRKRLQAAVVTRADIASTLEAWARRELDAQAVWAWAEERYFPGDTDFDDWEGRDENSVANVVLGHLDMLPMNLVLPEDIPALLELLGTEPGRFDEGYRVWAATQERVDWNARRRAVASQEPYARFCK